MSHTIRKYAAGLISATAIMTSAAQADVTNLKEALALAMEQKPIASGGDKMKLFSLYANYNGDNRRWSFQFYDSGTKLHNVTVNKSGKTRYEAREKDNRRIFDDLDFSKLPSPADVLIPNLVNKAKAALATLKFKTPDTGNIYMRYSVRSEFRHRDKAYHAWTVTLPINDGKQGKSVTFKNGQLDEITNAAIYGG